MKKFIIEDPETDKVPNLVVQLRKSMDTGGAKPILFKDGTSFTIPVQTMITFLDLYASLKPIDREEMQNTALRSKDEFIEVLTGCDKPKAPKSIY
jgi:hypothetical protein